ncbi:MAG: translation initiation factor IF-2 subunit alpha [Candidatus Woesearchaeota archaeon]|nr:translation initiation factor IF-2 subunit alpha [Candidatus Woesearchaeota archaeon]
MLFRKEGFPEESEIVICTVQKVYQNAVFVLLDEYDKKGVIHITEIAPGRIRNLREYVIEGKKVICKVLRVDPEKGHIDLSLRRVTEMQKKEKQEQIKLEQKAEKILELAAKEAGKDLAKVYNDIKGVVFSRYPSLYACFEDVIAGNFSINDLKLEKNLSDALENLIRSRIRPPEVEIKGELKMESYEPNGVEIIKDALKRGKDENISIKYLGAGKFSFSVKAEDYKKAENIMKKSIDAITGYMKKHNSTAIFTREEKD